MNYTLTDNKKIFLAIYIKLTKNQKINLSNNIFSGLMVVDDSLR